MVAEDPTALERFVWRPGDIVILSSGKPKSLTIDDLLDAAALLDDDAPG